MKRHDKNPFTTDMSIPVKGKQVQLSPMGKDENILINNSTGEVHGTHVTTFKKVDAEQFVKLFTANIALTFDLKPAGIKAFSILVWTMQERGIERDLIALDKYTVEDFLMNHLGKEISQATFWRGLAELVDAKIIAHHLRQGWYYINPNFIFNGNRIAFTTMIEKEESKPKKGQGGSIGKPELGTEEEQVEMKI